MLNPAVQSIYAQVTDSITLDDRAVEEHSVRAMGPGGQNVEEESAIERRLDIGASSLP